MSSHGGNSNKVAIFIPEKKGMEKLPATGKGYLDNRKNYTSA